MPNKDDTNIIIHPTALKLRGNDGGDGGDMLEQRVANLEEDVKEIRVDIREIRADVSILKTEVVVIQTTMAACFGSAA